MATDEERDRVETTPSGDSAGGPSDAPRAGDPASSDESSAVDDGGADSGADDGVDAGLLVDADELEIDDPEALERATGRVSDSELTEDDDLVDEPTNAELAELTEGSDATAKAARQAEAESERGPGSDAAGETDGDDRELVGVGAPRTGRRTKSSGAEAKSSKQPTQKKGRATPKRDGASPEHKRTGPVTFVKESVGELRKVVYPTGPQLLNYFVVVLIFVLFIIAFVSVLDLAFGWAILKVFS